MQANTVTDIKKRMPTIADIYEASTGSPLTGSGDEWKGLCLVHDDHKPSCSYNLAKDAWHCKVCSKSGGVKTLLSALFPEAKSRREFLVTHRFLDPSEFDWANATKYDYLDENGVLLFQVGRDAAKQFPVRFPTADPYNWRKTQRADDRMVPYRLPELIRSRKRGETVYVVEGEKDADNLFAFGYAATTTKGGTGAKKVWTTEFVSEFFGEAERVVVLCDNDEAGRKAGRERAILLCGVVADVRLIEALPGVAQKGDISDWIAANPDDHEAFDKIVAGTARFVPPVVPDRVVNLVARLTDQGNAEWFKAVREHKVVWRPEISKWAKYRHKVWTIAEVNPEAEAQKAIEEMRAAAKGYEGPLADEFAAHVETLDAAKATTNMLQKARGIMGRFERFFDADGQLFVCDWGKTLDLRKLDDPARPSNFADYVTMKSPVAYDPDAVCPAFRAWLMECCGQSQPLFDYMQEVMGSCLEARPGLRRFYFLFGPKGTGKSSFIRILEALLGPYAASVDFKALVEAKFSGDGNGPSPAIARLKGRRMVSASEARDSDRLDVARIKSLIGGDTQTARSLHEGISEFKFEATLIMSGNEVPRIVGDDSIWDKLKLVPFTHPIVTENPNFEADVILPELPGILIFALDGLRRLRACNYQTGDPHEVVDARNAEKDDQDPFAEWLSERMELANGYAAPCEVVYADYAAWCTKSKSSAFTQKKLTRWLREKHGVGIKRGTAKSYDGVRPKYAPPSAGGSGMGF